jgi:hypothetical protein
VFCVLIGSQCAERQETACLMQPTNKSAAEEVFGPIGCNLIRVHTKSSLSDNAQASTLWVLSQEREGRRSTGGGGGIRTHEGLSSLPVFKTGAFNRSATPPGLLGFIASALTARLFAGLPQPFERARLKAQLAHRLRVRRTAQPRRVVNLVGAK